MLKPASTTNMDQDYVEYYPHIIFLHNKAELEDFMPSTLEMMKVQYYLAFNSITFLINYLTLLFSVSIM